MTEMMSKERDEMAAELKKTKEILLVPR